MKNREIIFWSISLSILVLCVCIGSLITPINEEYNKRTGAEQKLYDSLCNEIKPDVIVSNPSYKKETIKPDKEALSLIKKLILFGYITIDEYSYNVYFNSAIWSELTNIKAKEVFVENVFYYYNKKHSISCIDIYNMHTKEKIAKCSEYSGVIFLK